MKELEKIDEKLLNVNPFSFSLKIAVTEVLKSGEFEKVESEELSEGVFLNKSYYIERLQSTKIYYCPECKDRIYGLSDKAQRMYLYILYNINRGKDWIQINKENYKTRNKIKSDTTVNEALKELMTEGFISATIYKSAFWINPTLFYSGNRLKKYPTTVDVKQTIYSNDLINKKESKERQ